MISWSAKNLICMKADKQADYDSVQGARTSAIPRGMCLLRNFCRSSLLPWYRMTFIDGNQRLNSSTQLDKVDKGPTTMKGPLIFLPLRWLRKPMVCTCNPRQLAKLELAITQCMVIHEHKQHMSFTMTNSEHWHMLFELCHSAYCTTSCCDSQTAGTLHTHLYNLTSWG